MDTLLQDLRYAARTLLRSPGFTLIAVLTLALGIGATTTMFGVVDALFLSPPAGVRDADEIVRLYIVRNSGNIQTSEGGPGSYPDYRAMRANARGFAGLAAFGSPRDVDLGRGEGARQLKGQVVTENFFDVLGVRTARGRLFAPVDSAADANPIVVVSHQFWEHDLGGAPNVLGRELRLNGTLATIVGVAPEGFAGIDPEPVDVWIPAAQAAPLGLSPEGWQMIPFAAFIDFIGRLAPGTAPELAQASTAAALRNAAAAEPDLDPTPGVQLGPLLTARGPKRAESASVALWLAFATGLVLLIACANVANLLFARTTVRRREIAVRLSLGVGRGRLVRQLLTESLVLGLMGGAGGLLLALWGAGLVRQFPIPPTASRLDLRVLAFTLAVSVATGVLFGLAPALGALRTDPVAELKGTGPADSRGRGRLRGALVAGQVALAFAALVGAGLFVRSLGRVLAIDPGVDLDRVAVVSVDLEDAGYDAAAQQAFAERASERLRALPGVEYVSSVRITPLSGAAMSLWYDLPGPDSLAVNDGDEGPYFNWVTPGYFRTVGMRLLEGRDFTGRDREGAPPVAVVNEAFAWALTPSGSALGRCIAIGDQREEGGCTEIVGVVSDRRHRILDEPFPYIILPWLQHPDEDMGATQLLIRTRGEPDESAGRIRDAVQGLAPDLPFVSVQPLEDLVREDLLPFRIGATLSALFGVLALVLAALGLYGVLAYVVAQRTHEIGVRRALGARNHDVIGFVVQRTLSPVVLGLVLGLAAAFAGTRILAALLYETAPRDPLTFAAVALLLAAVALLASYLPARRATRVDPMIALRHE